MTEQTNSPSRIIRKEAAVFAGGFAEFYGTLSGKIRSGDLVAWFLVLSPWLAWQVVRLALLGWRAAAKM